MTAGHTPPAPGRAAGAEEHARRMFLLAAARLRERVPESRFPFLRDYRNDVPALAAEAWRGDPAAPLHRLASLTGLDLHDLVELFTVALVDEDARFGAVFEAYAGHSRPTTGLLHAWWPESRPVLRGMRRLGLLTAAAGVSAADEILRVPAVVWDAVRGDPPSGDGPVRHRPPAQALALDALILEEALATRVGRLPDALASGRIDTVVLRGPDGSGRQTLAASVAAVLGRGLLVVDPDDESWRSAAVLAALLDALPLVRLDLAPGEHRELSQPAGGPFPLFVVAGRRGGLGGPAVGRAVTLELAVAGPAERERHWRRALEGGSVLDPPLLDPTALGARYRLAGGHIGALARAARAAALLEGRPAPDERDVATAVRGLQRHQFDAMATRVETPDSWSGLVVTPETMRDLTLAEARCRHREALAATLPGTSAGAPGVRLLFRGPSGTGKTLAARTLAGVLGLDLYAVDLATVVNKYIGETEKNLDRLLSRAEETGAALLLDEGDALLSRRTAVESSNDRYANLETNFLLQRLESFEGILVVTTNASARIDRAFERRMDVVVDFGPPDETERWWLWQLHLPTGHVVSGELLDALAVQCVMTGAEIRNTVVHATLLALDEGCRVGDEQVAEATRRELEKAGRVSPLPLRGHDG